MAITVANLDPPVAPSGFPKTSPISFDLVSPSNIDFVSLSLRYISDANEYMVYETDGFTAPYGVVSSIANIGTTTVSCTLFEHGAWRDRIYRIQVVVISGGAIFRFDLSDLGS